MKKSHIIIAVFVMLMVCTTAFGDVYPREVRPGPYGLDANVWMAGIAIVCAIIDNLGRWYDKKAENPDLKYNHAYGRATLIAIALMGVSVLGMDVVTLGPEEILTAIILGFGGNLAVKEATKGTR